MLPTNIKAGEILNRILDLQEGQSLADFCQSVGLNYETTRKCFQRNGSLDSESLSRIAEYFQLDLQWLITGTEPSSTLNQTVAKKLKALRVSRGWSLEELGSRLSMSPKVIELYQQGKCLFSSDLIQKFSEALEVHPSVFTDEGSLLCQSPQLKIFRPPALR